MIKGGPETNIDGFQLIVLSGLFNGLKVVTIDVTNGSKARSGVLGCRVGHTQMFEFDFLLRDFPLIGREIPFLDFINRGCVIA